MRGVERPKSVRVCSSAFRLQWWSPTRRAVMLLVVFEVEGDNELAVEVAVLLVAATLDTV